MLRSPLVLLALALFATSAGVFVAQAAWQERFPGNYPDLEKPIRGEWAFDADAVRVRLTEDTKDGRVTVFAYTPDGDLLGLLKPIAGHLVTVRPGDLADFRLEIRDGKIGAMRFLKAMDRYSERHDMARALAQAKAAGRRHGLQRCLYPVCQRCLDGCRSVISNDDLPIVMEVGAEGHIHPAFAKGKCPRCGKCFTWCPSGLITERRSLGF